MSHNIGLEGFLKEIKFDDAALKDRLDRIVDNSTVKANVVGVLLEIFGHGVKTGLNGVDRTAITLDGDQKLIDLMRAACLGFYDMGYEFGAKLQPQVANPLFVAAVTEHVAAQIIEYGDGREAADHFRERQKGMWAEYN